MQELLEPAQPAVPRMREGPHPPAVVEHYHVQYIVSKPPPYHEVLHLFVGVKTKGPNQAQDGSTTYITMRGACTVVPGRPYMAYTARGNLLGFGKRNMKLPEGSDPLNTSHKAVWAVTIRASKFNTILEGHLEGLSPDATLSALLAHGAKPASRYKITISEEDACAGKDAANLADSQLCMLEFDLQLVNPSTMSPAADVDFFEGEGDVEILQLGFPKTICTNPEWSQAEGTLHWAPNPGFSQSMSKYMSPKSTLREGQDTLTLNLHCSTDFGDEGGGAYLVLRDRQFPGKSPYAHVLAGGFCLPISNAAHSSLQYLSLCGFPSQLTQHPGSFRMQIGKMPSWLVMSCNGGAKRCVVLWAVSYVTGGVKCVTVQP
jgi:hypothetical protein